MEGLLKYSPPAAGTIRKEVMNESEQISSSPSVSSQERLHNLLRELKQEDIDKFIAILTRLKEESPKIQNNALPNAVLEDREVLPSRKTRWVKNITPEQNKRKRIEQVFIADSFVKYGINYHYITQRFPQMSPKTYRCVVQGINNHVVNDVIRFLRYECNIEIERMNRDHKRSIRTQLTKVKEWLGNRDMDQLDCFHRFICRRYGLKQVTIAKDEAVKLYTTILSIIKSPTVNVFEEGADREEVSICGLNKEEVNTLLVLFIKWKDLTKVADLMCQKYGYHVQFSSLAIKNGLKQVLEASVDKLICNMKNREKDEYLNYFTPRNRALLHDVSENEMKVNLYSYYMDTKNNYIKVKNLLIKLRDFFDKYAGDETIEVTMPKVQTTTKEEVVKQEEVSAFELTKTIHKEDSLKSEDMTEDESSLSRADQE